MAAPTISRGLAEQYREQAALLYMEAFRPLLQPLLGDGPRSLDLLARSMNPTHAFAATGAGGLAGLAGIQDAAGSLLDIGLPQMIRSYGLPGGSLRYLAMALMLSRSRQPGSLLMDGIAVAPECRGQGIGTQLLQAVCEHARDSRLPRRASRRAGQQPPRPRPLRANWLRGREGTLVSLFAAHLRLQRRDGDAPPRLSAAYRQFA